MIGEFICDEIRKYYPISNIDPINKPYGDDILASSRVSAEELNDFAWSGSGYGKLYGWHISAELKIYDKPRKLSEFNIVDNAAVLSCIHREIIGQPEYKTAHNGWIKGSYICHAGSEPDWCTKCRTKPLERPPQSWCYVEASGNE